MIDFTNLQRKNKSYAETNGNKISVMYQNKLYMLIFSSHARQNKDMIYTSH